MKVDGESGAWVLPRPPFAATLIALITVTLSIRSHHGSLPVAVGVTVAAAWLASVLPAAWLGAFTLWAARSGLYVRGNRHAVRLARNEVGFVCFRSNVSRRQPAQTAVWIFNSDRDVVFQQKLLWWMSTGWWTRRILTRQRIPWTFVLHNEVSQRDQVRSSTPPEWSTSAMRAAGIVPPKRK